MFRSLSKASIVLIILLLVTSDLGFKEMLPELGVKAMEVGEGGEEEEEALALRKVAYDGIGGCTCYRNEDCKNSPGCGNYCSWGVIVGFCRKYELHEV